MSVKSKSRVFRVIKRESSFTLKFLILGYMDPLDPRLYLSACEIFFKWKEAGNNIYKTMK